MRLIVVCVGRVRAPFADDVAHYERLIARHARLQTIELPEPRREGDALVAHVQSIDRYGNAALNVSHEGLAGTGITLGGQVEIVSGTEHFHATVGQTFADVRRGDILFYEDSYRALSIAINRGDAAATLQLAPDSEVRVTPR